MSAVSEEDVLCHLILWACRPVTTNCDSIEQFNERLAWNAAMADMGANLNPVAVIALQRLQAHETLGAAIADSERRYEAEVAGDLVLQTARDWRDGQLSMEDLDAALAEYEGALAEVARHAGR